MTSKAKKWGYGYPSRPTPSACASAYQLAGDLLLTPDLLTEGQRDRMRELLLNFLDEPGRYTGKILRDLHRMAKEP